MTHTHTQPRAFRRFAVEVCLTKPRWLGCLRLGTPLARTRFPLVRAEFPLVGVALVSLSRVALKSCFHDIARQQLHRILANKERISMSEPTREAYFVSL